MIYAYQLRAHPNARYQESLLTLSTVELQSMLLTCGVQTIPYCRTLGGAPFLCFACEALTPAQSMWLQQHSCLYMAAVLEDDALLRPLDIDRARYLPANMPDILKYKGKTNPAFTHLLINLALAAGGHWQTRAPLLLDPLCGRGTTLFCALTRGMDVIGIEANARDIREGMTYAQKWLQLNRVKYEVISAGMTLPGGGNAPLRGLRVKGERELLFINADSGKAGALPGKRRAHALIADLPYGVQHAPTQNGRVGTLTALLEQSLRAWRQALLPGAAAAIAFNTHTLARKTLCVLAEDAGFSPLNCAPYDGASHWVEQAVNRDVLVALNPASPY